jgi:hypothetical protein
VLSGPLKDSTIPLTEDEVTIGRDPANGIAVTDPSVSRKHCTLSSEEGRFRVRDLESRNGTLVNGVAVQQHYLQHGDQIAAGDSGFLFLLEEDDTVPVASRVEFENADFAAATTIIHPRDVVYLQPDRLSRELPSNSRLANNLNALLKISRVVHAIRDLNELQGQLLDLIFEVVPAGRGAILLADSEGQQFNSMFARVRQTGKAPLVKVSRTVARQVLEQGIAILGSDVPANDQLRAADRVPARDWMHLPRQRQPRRPSSGRPSAAGDGDCRHFCGRAGKCPAAALAGAGKPALDRRNQPGAQPGGRRRAHERGVSVSEARGAERFDGAD